MASATPRKDTRIRRRKTIGGIRPPHMTDNARDARLRKNANQKLTRLIDTALAKLDEAGKMYDCKVYLVIQTHKGQWTTYNNARGQDWPPSDSQIKCFAGARRLGPDTYNADLEQATPAPSYPAPSWNAFPMPDPFAGSDFPLLQPPLETAMGEAISAFPGPFPDVLSAVSST